MGNYYQNLYCLFYIAFNFRLGILIYTGPSNYRFVKYCVGFDSVFNKTVFSIFSLLPGLPDVSVERHYVCNTPLMILSKTVSRVLAYSPD